MIRPSGFPALLRPGDPFPDPETALTEPDGLLAIGGDLSVSSLRRAYATGIFPWFGPDEPILWWSPDPRSLLDPRALHIRRSLRKRLRQPGIQVRVDTAFDQVIEACAAPRAGGRENTATEDTAGADVGSTDDWQHTWIVPAMRVAFSRLHAAGDAHSIEVWRDARLVGGLYGVAVGRVFCGESMFHREPDASKIALAWLCTNLIDWGFELIDVQQDTDHLRSLGATAVARRKYLQQLQRLGRGAPHPQAWRGPLRAPDGVGRSA